ncbi:hypothetical protein GY45DRAFT_174839 [Cubamyces sp. BRFM 1775]|nr:hypothetical protein GY45DRAFT_174839 [Cubamyces sp. BRFM 1775]
MCVPLLDMPLPNELLDAIGHVTAQRALPAFLLTCKRVNNALTPLLYASITLDEYTIAQRCTDTLAADPTEHHAGRDLAAYVRSFAVTFGKYGMEWDPARFRFARSLEGSLIRMSGLQHLDLQSTCFTTPKICIAFARGAARTLRSLSFVPEEKDEWMDDSKVNTLDGFRPEFAELTSVSLGPYIRDSRPWHAFFQHVLTSRGAHLRKLSICGYNDFGIEALFACPGAWSALEELEIELLRDYIPAAFANFPPGLNLRKLTMIYPFSVGGPEDALELSGSIPAYVFPNLEHLSCTYHLLPAFLPVGASTHRRPIRTVCLNQIYHNSDWVVGDAFTRVKAPDWTKMQEVLGCLSRSAGPVVDLTLYVDGFDAESFPGELAHHIQSVERLVIVSQQEPRNAACISNYEELLFMHTPRLHAFFLAEARIRTWMSGERALFFLFSSSVRDHQKIWLEQWENNIGALTKAAFATDCSWKRTDGGWVMQRRK